MGAISRMTGMLRRTDVKNGWDFRWERFKELWGLLVGVFLRIMMICGAGEFKNG